MLFFPLEIKFSSRNSSSSRKDFQTDRVAQTAVENKYCFAKEGWARACLFSVTTQKEKPKEWKD